MTAAYAGLSIPDVLDLPYLIYLQWRRDAYITRLEQSDKGREYLENAYRMEQSEPDRAGLRKMAGRR